VALYLYPKGLSSGIIEKVAMRFSQRKKILVLIVGILIILSLNFFQKEVRGFFYSLSSSLQQSFWGAGERVSDFFAGIFSAKDLKEEVAYLRTKNQALMAENISLKELVEENETLRVALNVGLQKEFKLALAEIIGKDIGQDTILINAGSKDGILGNMPVITQEKVLVGRISEAYDNFSKVTLISNKDSSFDAKVADKDISAVVKGEGNLKLFLDLIPQEKEIKEGDLIVSTAFGGIYPKGLLVGLVGEVKKSDVSAFQQAEIVPFFDLGETNRVFIILD
jgi:rod shape-determining protein MreC